MVLFGLAISCSWDLKRRAVLFRHTIVGHRIKYNSDVCNIRIGERVRERVREREREIKLGNRIYIGLRLDFASEKHFGEMLYPLSLYLTITFSISLRD
jgi:hypothetical protein